jgi:acetyltransferase-like isoleucine patch superfamily enzyme
MIGRRRLYRLLLPSCLAAVLGLPTVLAFGPVFAAPAGLLRLLAVAFAPIVFCVAMPLVAGLFARTAIAAIVAGKFDRDLGDPIYGKRRVYGLCWTAIYYCPPVYHFVLAVPWLKRATLRLFGYRGSLDVAMYPDTWIRDLPLLELASGAYLSNKATIGTNMCLPGGKIIVAPVSVGRNAMVGHLAMIAPGVVLGEGVEMGVGSAVGIRTLIGPRSTIGPCAVVYHGVRIGAGCHIGGACSIGSKSVIADGITIPFGTVVPPRSRIASQGDVESLRSDEPHLQRKSIAVPRSVSGLSLVGEAEA